MKTPLLTALLLAITCLAMAQLPSGWQSCTIGNANGSASFNNDAFTLSSKGYSSSSSDVIEYVYKEVSGNASIVCHVVSISGSGWAALHFRESCSPGSRKVTFKTQLYNPMVRSEFRPVANGSTTVREFVCPNITWLRLERTGNTFRGYTSTNGQQWKLVFTLTNQMTDAVLLGIISEGYSFNVATTVMFDQVSLQ